MPTRAPAGRGRLERLRARCDRLADELVLLDAACWRGELNGRGLRRLQRLRVHFAELDGRIAAQEPGRP